MPEEQDGCVAPAGGPVMEGEQETATESKPEKESIMTARVGRPAPDFEASAFVDGGFKNVRLSSFKGKWLVLCFYPGDFTFV